MTKAFVSFVIPTYNRRVDLEVALPCIMRQRYPSDRYEIIVVDNSSQDGTEEWVKSFRASWDPPIHYVRNLPQGPAAARNVGARLARGELLAFVDSDVCLDLRWLDQVVTFLEKDPTVGIVTGKLLYAEFPRLLNAYGGAISPIGLAWDAYEGESEGNAGQPRVCLWTGCSAMLMRRTLWAQIEGFDEAFFYGYEDSDLGWRANLAGARVICIPGALAYHRVSQTCGKGDSRIVFHYCKNRLRSMVKNYGGGRLVRYLPAYLLYSIVDLLLRAPRCAKIKALLWNVWMLRDTLRHRVQIQATRQAREASLRPLWERRWFPIIPLSNRRRRPIVAQRSSPVAASSPAASVRDDRVGVQGDEGS